MSLSANLLKEDILDSNNATSEIEVCELEQERSNRKLVRWVRTSGLAILDQGLISGSNFLVGILLARWLSPAEYGAYAVAFSVLLLLLLVYQSVMLEPMTVFGASTYRYSMRSYFERLLSMHTAVTLIIFAALGMAAFVARSSGQSGTLPGALVGITFAAPCILLFWLARRAFYLGSSLVPAAAASAVYFVVLLSGMFVAYRARLLSPRSAFMVMGLGALLTSVVLLGHLRRVLVGAGTLPSSGELWRRHWRYGRWALASCVAGWVPTYIYYPILSSFSGMGSVGELKALTNLGLPLFQTYSALAMLLIPHIAGIRGEETPERILVFTGKITMMFVGGAMVYWAILLPFRTTAFLMLYSGKYLEVGYLTPLVALESILWAATCGPAITLRGIESPASVFWARCASSFVSVSVGIAATLMYGIHGALWAMAASSGATLLLVVILLRRKVAENIGLHCLVSDASVE